MQIQVNSKLIDLFHKMSEEEKEAHVQGIEHTLDYGYQAEDDDYLLYNLILEEREQKASQSPIR